MAHEGHGNHLIDGAPELNVVYVLTSAGSWERTLKINSGKSLPAGPFREGRKHSSKCKAGFRQRHKKWPFWTKLFTKFSLKEKKAKKVRKLATFFFFSLRLISASQVHLLSG